MRSKKYEYCTIFKGFSEAKNKTIQTIPELTNNVFAYGFHNLTLKARFPKINYQQCNWYVKGRSLANLGVNTFVIFSPFISCGRALPCYEEDVANVTYINTDLTISNPINYSIFAWVECDSVQTQLIWIGVPKSKFYCSIAIYNHSKIK